ncbi:DUF6286 domain-containing protein [Streptomyces sp. NPDC057702]|uniref:DUF6286 domain-containing protein n=1 Tax=unclassified Streptomyces TaxID=2593676 RepID=UPI0036BE33FD
MSSASEPKPTGPTHGRVHRPWSARRGPAAVLALLGSAACGMLLYDQVAMEYGRPAAPWRTHTRDWLADTPGTSGWVIAAAGILALLGLYLMVLALTPGGRRRLPMAPPAPAVRAVLDRASATALLRDAALHTPGVTAARVRMRGRRVARVRATVAYGEGEAVRAALRAELLAATHRLGLARPPRLRLRLTLDAATQPHPQPAPKPPSPHTTPPATPAPAPRDTTVPHTPAPAPHEQGPPPAATPDTTASATRDTTRDEAGDAARDTPEDTTRHEAGDAARDTARDTRREATAPGVAPATTPDPHTPPVVPSGPGAPAAPPRTPPAAPAGTARTESPSADSTGPDGPERDDRAKP